MATVTNTIQLRDRMTPVLRSVIRAMRSTADALAEVDGISNRAFNRMRSDIAAAESALGDFSRQVPNVQDPVDQVTSGFSGWQKAIVVANQALQLIQQGAQKVSQALDWASTMTDQQSRLKLIADEQTDVYQLQEMITASAMRTRSSYESTADSVISMYSSLSGYGATLSQSVRLSEILNKQLGAAGVKGAAQESVMYNLNQSLAAGVLRWEDWRIISSNAGGMVANLAKAAGVTSAEFNKMVQDGEITAARFAELLWQTAEGAEGIDAVFEEMPDTFADWMTNIQTFASGEFLSEGGLGDKLNEVFASDGWLEIVNQIKTVIASLFSWISAQADKINAMIQSRGAQSFLHTLGRIGAAIAGVIGLAVSFGTAIVENWSWIEPIILGIVTAVLLYNGALFALNAAQTITNALQFISILRTSAQAAALMMQSGATFGATVAQYGLNAALLACPLTWILLIIIAVIAAIYAIVGAINKVTGSTLSATGLIFGTILTVVAIIWNTIIGVLNGIIQFVWSRFVEPFISYIEFVLNVANGGFNSFGDAVANLIGNVIGWFLSLGQVVTKIIDAIFGTNWTAGLESMKSSVIAWGKNEQAITLSREAPTIESMTGGAVGTWNYNDAFATGYGFGEYVDGSVGDMASGISGLNESALNANELAAETLNLAEGEGVAVKGSVEIDEDTISLLKDVAAVEWVNKYTTLRPELNVTFGDVHETADTEGLLSAMETMIEEAYASALVGEE